MLLWSLHDNHKKKSASQKGLQMASNIVNVALVMNI